jgi:hypothetical protein
MRAARVAFLYGYLRLSLAVARLDLFTLAMLATDPLAAAPVVATSATSSSPSTHASAITLRASTGPSLPARERSPSADKREKGAWSTAGEGRSGDSGEKHPALAAFELERVLRRQARPSRRDPVCMRCCGRPASTRSALACSPATRSALPRHLPLWCACTAVRALVTTLPAHNFRFGCRARLAAGSLACCRSACRDAPLVPSFPRLSLTLPRAFLSYGQDCRWQWTTLRTPRRRRARRACCARLFATAASPTLAYPVCWRQQAW